jgi:ABC-2 type transport system permease protein
MVLVLTEEAGVDTLRFSWHFLGRQVRATTRLPSAFFLSSFHPFVWMLLFGSLFSVMASVKGFPPGSYVQFLAPGIAVMAALFGATYSGLGILGDLHSGLLDRFLAAPVPRLSVIAGPLLGTALNTVLQSAIILLTAVAMGARPRGGVGGVLMVFFTVALMGSAFAALSHGLALLTRQQRTMISVVNFISLPLVFLSTMTLSRALMPAWMRAVSYFNPVDWAVTVSRSAFAGTLDAGALLRLGLLAVVSAGAWGFAIYALNRFQNSG